MINVLLKQYGILCIAGPSGSGKTTLAQFITGHLLAIDITRQKQAIWIQASEDFSNKRLEALFSQEPRLLDYLKKNIFVIPGNVPCSNIIEQQLVLHKIISKESILPPNVKFIIIDNISHHLRYEFSRLDSLKEKSSLINGFFESLLSPLIMKCRREKINLILIHEISYIPKLKRERPFLYKVYDRIQAINIELIKDMDSRKKKMNISINSGKIQNDIEYELCNSGVMFC